MNTVVYTNSVVGTVNQSCLPAVAEQVIQENTASTLAKAGMVKWSCTCKMTMQYNITPIKVLEHTIAKIIASNSTTFFSLHMRDTLWCPPSAPSSHNQIGHLRLHSPALRE